jgi:hypothetical protein
MEEDARMRFRIEHFHAVEVPDTPLGYEFAPTGQVDELDAHDEADAAATALSGEEAVSHVSEHARRFAVWYWK